MEALPSHLLQTRPCEQMSRVGPHRPPGGAEADLELAEDGGLPGGEAHVAGRANSRSRTSSGPIRFNGGTSTTTLGRW